MSVALAGHSPDTFDIKSSTVSLLSLRLKSADMTALAQELDAQYANSPGFFHQDLLVLDLSTLPPESPCPDFAHIKNLLLTYGLMPVGAWGGSADMMAAAAQAGLPSADMRKPAPSAAHSAGQEPAPKAGAAATTNAEAGQPEELPPGALVIDKPLRSGQRAYARGRDLVVMSMVNPGAEVIADGHIHVYAPLRGRALAGARGWTQARIFAREMQPELVSIAGVWRTCEEPLPPTIWGKAATLRLQSSESVEKLVFEPVNG